MTILELQWIWPDTPIMIGATLLIAVIAHLIVVTLIKRITNRVRKTGTKRAMNAQLAPTSTQSPFTSASASAQSSRTFIHMTAVARLLQSVWTFLLVVVVILTILSTVGVPLSPILTSAGIGGVVLAFGAQSLIKDYLSGISMIIEDQFGIGDQITVGEITGTVEDITLRVTKLRDMTGMIWYIRNGEILKVGNISQGYSTGLIDVPVAYDADINLVTEILSAVVEEVSQDDAIAPKLLEPPKLLGVESITATTMTVRIRIKTPANQQFGPARDIRERAMAALAAADIPAPIATNHEP